MGLPAILQWFVLRQHIRQGWLWVISGVVVGIVIVGLFINSSTYGESYILFALIGVLHGAITGATMVYLLAQHRTEKVKAEAT